MAGMVVPFQEEVAVENYFPGIEFEKILVQVRKNLAGSPALMVLTGEEGSGKTMLCMKLAQDGSRHETILFLDLVEAFGEVVSHIADCLEVPLEEGSLSTDEVIGRIADSLREQKRPVLVIFDQAENIYLATLERIRKMFDFFHETGSAIHLLFSGRPVFLENYEQLSICDFEEMGEQFFELPPLHEEETVAYICSTVEKNPELGEAGQIFFRPGTTESIYSASHGNLAQINKLALKALDYPGDGSSFATLLDSAEEKACGQGRDSSPFVPLEMLEMWRERLREAWQRLLESGCLLHERKKLLAWGGGGVLLLSLLFWGVGGRQNPIVQEELENQKVVEVVEGVNEEKPSATAVILPDSLPQEEKLQKEKASDVVAAPEKTEDGTSASSEEPKAALREQGEAAGLQIENKAEGTHGKAEPLVIGVKKKKREVSPPDIVQVEAEPVVITRQKSKRLTGISLESSGEKAQTSVQQESNLQAESTLQKDKGVLVLRPLKKVKYRERVQEASQTGISSISGLGSELDRLIQNRFVAGMGWRSGSKDGHYTVQLMVLQSSQGRDGLKRLFTAKKYRPLVTDFYLFSKGDKPETVCIYYGEFKSMAAAEKAAVNLSPMFPGYNPFAIAVKDAMAKFGDRKS